MIQMLLCQSCRRECSVPFHRFGLADLSSALSRLSHYMLPNEVADAGETLIISRGSGCMYIISAEHVSLDQGSWARYSGISYQGIMSTPQRSTAGSIPLSPLAPPYTVPIADVALLGLAGYHNRPRGLWHPRLRSRSGGDLLFEGRWEPATLRVLLAGRQWRERLGGSLARVTRVERWIGCRQGWRRHWEVSGVQKEQGEGC